MQPHIMLVKIKNAEYMDVKATIGKDLRFMRSGLPHSCRNEDVSDLLFAMQGHCMQCP